ncbi:MAG: cation:proton antiporter [Bacteroidia bacterium]|nr:cation:proton antiporter [Bacteroidia bacterium]
MGHLSILLHLAVVFGIAVLVVRVFKRLGFPVVIAYLVTGILISPNHWDWTGSMAEAEQFAEVGVILLLFTVGLEFSVKNLWKIRHLVLLGGALQMLFTVALAALFGLLFGFTLVETINYGFLLSLSSTAIVIKLLQERYQMASEHGKILLGVLLFQDIAVVPLLLAQPLLAGQGGDAPLATQVGLLLLKLGGLGVVAWLAARYVLPRLLFQVMQIKSQEVFLLATISLVGFITALTSELGLSLALGAFIAGLIISETDYNRLAISCMLPFRYVFLSFFFISLGMLVDLRFLWEDPVRLIGTVFYIVALKALAAFLAVRLLRVPARTAIVVGLGMAQVGEFAFVMAGASLEYGLLRTFWYQQFLIASIGTMALTPLLLARGGQVADWLLARLGGRRPFKTVETAAPQPPPPDEL